MTKKGQSHLIKAAKNIFIENQDESQVRPLLIIVSWSNATIRQAQKYGDLYKSENYTIVYFLGSVIRTILLNSTKLQRDSMKLVNIITNEICKNKNRKVTFHIFSMPGPAVFNNIMNYYFGCAPKNIDCFGYNKFRKQENEPTPNISGVVFDSAILNSPDKKKFGLGVKGMTTNRLAKPFFYAAGNLMRRVTPQCVTLFSVWVDLNKNIPGGYPHLVIFSKVDPIIPYREILDIIDYRKENGEDITYHLFEDSKHVLHLRQYPDIYKSLMEEYLRKVNDLPVNRRKVWKSVDGLEREIDINGNLNTLKQGLC